MSISHQSARLLHSLRALACAGVIAALAVAATAHAQGNLVVYCSTDADFCELAAAEFSKQTGVRVNITRKATGEAYAQLRAEASNPKADVWWGGTGDPYLQAADEELLAPYTSARMQELAEWAIAQHRRSQGKVVGIYTSTIGFGYNTDLIAKKKVAPPKCWSDLVKPEYKGEVELSHPASSGTAYTILATLVQLMGEDKAFDYMKALHRNVSQYTRSGNAQSLNVGRGEAMIGVSFAFGFVVEKVKSNFPIEIAYPCEGTGYEIGSMAIVKGARNLDNAKKFYDWALTPQAQALGAQAKSFQLPSNTRTPVDARIPRLEGVKLIDYDFTRYGSGDERKRLIARWEKEINAQPR